MTLIHEFQHTSSLSPQGIDDIHFTSESILVAQNARDVRLLEVVAPENLPDHPSRLAYIRAYPAF